MTNKTQVQGDFYLTDWITFQGGFNEEMFLKPPSAVQKLVKNWILLIFIPVLFYAYEHTGTSPDLILNVNPVQKLLPFTLQPSLYIELSISSFSKNQVPLPGS